MGKQRNYARRPDGRERSRRRSQRAGESRWWRDCMPFSSRADGRVEQSPCSAAQSPASDGGAHLLLLTPASSHPPTRRSSR